MDESSQAATRLWTLAQPTVSAFVHAVVHDFKDRDDVLQEIAIAAFRNFDSYDSERPFLPWVMGLARNQVGLYLRRRKRDRLVFSEETVASLADTFTEKSPEMARRLDALGECLKLLQGRAREICRLRYQEDIKPAGIAESLGMPPNGVSKALQRIREQLRDCILRRSRPQEGGLHGS